MLDQILDHTTCQSLPYTVPMKLPCGSCAISILQLTSLAAPYRTPGTPTVLPSNFIPLVIMAKPTRYHHASCITKLRFSFNLCMSCIFLPEDSTTPVSGFHKLSTTASMSLIFALLGPEGSVWGNWW